MTGWRLQGRRGCKRHSRQGCYNDGTALRLAVAASTPIRRISRHFDLSEMDRRLRQIETLVGS